MKYINKTTVKSGFFALIGLLVILLVKTSFTSYSYSNATFQIENKHFVKGMGDNREEYLISQFEFIDKSWKLDCLGTGGEYEKQLSFGTKTIYVCDNVIKKDLSEVFWTIYFYGFKELMTYIIFLFLFLIFWVKEMDNQESS